MKSYTILSVLVLFAGTLAITSCGEKTTRFERLLSEVTGIGFVNEVMEKDSFNILHNEYMYNGGGVGVADLNNDGLTDLIFTGNKVSTRIYLNQGGFKFRDITGQFKGISNKQWISGVAVTDINADGWVDLYFTSTLSSDSLLRKNQLWVNQGPGPDSLPSFVEKAAEYGIADMGYSMHATFFDYDLDGDLDLYVLNNIVSKEVPTNYRPKITDGNSINNDRLYRNEGNGRFTDVTLPAGVVYEGFGLGLAIGDVNKDGYPDIYVSNDYISNDLLYINQQDGTFKNQIREYMSYQSRFSMGNDMADINHDGNLDIITMDMMPEQYFRKKQTINGNSYNVYVYNEKYNYETQYVRNMLQLHNGFIDGNMLPFSEVGQLAGVYQTEWSWSPLFADFDNDGDRDLFITNGFPKDLTDKDFTNYKAQMYGYLAGDYDIIPRIPIVKVSNYAFENQGELRFVNQAKAWGLEIPSFSNGAAFADLDNDGDLDYAVNNINDEAFIYRNNSRSESSEEPADYLRLVLKGSGQNSLALGAKVSLWKEGRLLYQEQHLSRGYISSVDPVMHFGLGKCERIDSLRIIWPQGKTSTLLTGLESNQTIVALESDAKPFGLKAAPLASGEKRLFREMEGALPYVHVQEDFNDFFQNQRIIQHKFSQVGPCMVKGDLDGDGVDDLLIGASLQSPAAAFLRKGDAFVRVDLPGLTGDRSMLEADLVLTDVDGDGDNDVVAAAGGYANERESDYKHLLYLNQGGSFVAIELPLPQFPASVVRAIDYDRDGDQDLFIGARVLRGSFPKAPASWLLRNEGGQFTRQNAQALELGMVTDAVWSDRDGDGWKDLIVAREWNTLALVENKAGKSMEISPLKDFEGKSGFWHCVMAADFNGDGRDDYLVGNLGDNHRFNVSEEYPLQLYSLDIDNNGVIDPLMAGYWKDREGEMQEYPVNYLDELSAQSPLFRKKFTSYTKFSFATVDSIISRSALKEDQVNRVNTTSTYIIWNEPQGLRWERLPATVQAAPVRKILVQDLNGDKLPDALLVGNDHSFDVSTGYYDANRGICLMNRGKGGFSVLTPTQSGLGFRGQAEAVQYFEGDQPLLVVGFNRGRARVYKRE
jgi:hypothetical protein